MVEAAQGQYKALFKLAAETDARAGELYALTVDDLLFEHNVVRINKSMYKQTVGSPKTKNATRWVKKLLRLTRLTQRRKLRHDVSTAITTTPGSSNW